MQRTYTLLARHSGIAFNPHTPDPVKVPKRTNAGAQSIYMQIYTIGLLDTARNYIRNLHLSVEGDSYKSTYYDARLF